VGFHYSGLVTFLGVRQMERSKVSWRYNR
jgi:hypothetical protein